MPYNILKSQFGDNRLKAEVKMPGVNTFGLEGKLLAELHYVYRKGMQRVATDVYRTIDASMAA